MDWIVCQMLLTDIKKKSKYHGIGHGERGKGMEGIFFKLNLFIFKWNMSVFMIKFHKEDRHHKPLDT